MRVAALLLVVLLFAGCAALRQPPEPGTLVALSHLQEYADHSRVRLSTLVVGQADPENARRENARATIAVSAHALTLVLADRSRVTLADLPFARGPDVFFEADVPHTGIRSCELWAEVENASGRARAEPWSCGVFREWFIGLGEIGADGREGRVDVRVWRAIEGRMADWANGTVQHAPEEMAVVDDMRFTSWAFDVGRGTLVKGTEPPTRPAPGVYRFTFPHEGNVRIGIDSFRFQALTPEGRALTHEVADARIVG